MMMRDHPTETKIIKTILCSKQPASYRRFVNIQNFMEQLTQDDIQLQIL